MEQCRRRCSSYETTRTFAPLSVLVAFFAFVLSGRSSPEGGSLSCRRPPRGLLYEEGGSAAGEETEEDRAEWEERSSMFLRFAC